jgi:hypothetical protein
VAASRVLTSDSTSRVLVSEADCIAIGTVDSNFTSDPPSHHLVLQHPSCCIWHKLLEVVYHALFMEDDSRQREKIKAATHSRTTGSRANHKADNYNTSQPTA